MEAVSNKTAEFQQHAEERLKILLYSAMAEIQQANYTAASVGADVAECISNNKNTTMHVFDEAMQRVAACASDKVRE